MARTKTEPSTGDQSPALDPIRLGLSEPVRRIEGRNFTKADILVYRLDASVVAIKDYRPRGFFIRNTVGRFLIRREIRAYRAAWGLAGLPRFLGQIGPFAMALEYVEARPLAQLTDRHLDDGFFDRLEELVGTLHARGISLTDLHHRDVLVARDGSIFLVDLATAWIVGKRPGKLRRAVFRRLKHLDRIAVARMRARWTGREVGSAAASVDPGTAVWHARGRKVKALWDRLRGRR